MISRGDNPADMGCLILFMTYSQVVDIRNERLLPRRSLYQSRKVATIGIDPDELTRRSDLNGMRAQ